jgi:hypothetical protein
MGSELLKYLLEAAFIHFAADSRAIRNIFWNLHVSS